MRASRVLQKCLSDSLERCTIALARAVARGGGVGRGRRLTLMDVARSWPGAERVRAPLKASTAC